MRLRYERDSDLDPFREGVAVLRAEDGQIAGYLATVVEKFWSPSRPLTWQERVWWLVTWSDGWRERIEEIGGGLLGASGDCYLMLHGEVPDEVRARCEGLPSQGEAQHLGPGPVLSTGWPGFVVG